MPGFTVYVSIGSNIDRARNVRWALEQLKQRFRVVAVSDVYETEAVGFDGEPFYNLVVGFETEASVEAVREQLRRIEDRSGRDRREPRFSDRTLDIDLLLYGNLVVSENGLRLPREEITQNAYVLKPLSDVAARLEHPTLRKTYAELWSSLFAGKISLKVVDEVL